MRLSSLSRRLKIKPSELGTFYENRAITLTSGTNSKLTEEQINLALVNYGYEGSLDSISGDDVVELLPENEPSTESIVDTEEVLINQTRNEEPIVIMPPIEDLTQLIKNDEVIETSEEPEIIKATKVLLKGLTVKGKIELPNSQIKEVTKTITTEKLTSKNTLNVVKPLSEQFNPLEDERKSKAKKQQLLRKQEKSIIKEAKRRKYLEMHAITTPLPKKEKTKKVVIKRSHITKNNTASVPSTSKGNLLQQLWRWLNTF